MAGSEETGAAQRWGEGIGYPAWFEGVAPYVHRGFNAANRYFSIPALRMGLGRYMSTPFLGYLMILRTRGRKSGVMRDAPLGYYMRGEFVYVMAGFGRETHWFRNLTADPRVEVILPSGAFSGVAEEVTDPDERREILVPLIRSMGPMAMATGIGNPWRSTGDEIASRCEHFPLVRIRQTGVAPGPDDPGGWGWVVPLAVSAFVGARWLIGRRRGSRSTGAARCCACERDGGGDSAAL